MDGLYALKPWYAERLAAPRAVLVRRQVTPTAVSWTGVACAAVAGAALALLPTGPAAAVTVGVALALRLACANLDGGVARASGRTTAWGGVVNELSDRCADLVELAGLLAHTTPLLVAVAALGATLPSWVALAGAAAGLGRPQGGPVGKTERCLVLVVTAALGGAAAAALVLAAGGVATAAVRLAVLRRAAGGAR